MRTRRSRTRALSVSAGLLAFAGACRTASVQEPAVHVIEIRDMAFHPAESRVSVGDTVTWINRDFLPHTATANEGAWASGALNQEESWSWVAVGSGPKDYLCDFHPSMEGRVVINDGASRMEH